MVQDKVLKGSLVAVLDEQEERVWTFFSIDIFQDIGMGYFSKEVYLLKKRVCGDHGGVYGDLFHSKHSGFVGLARFVVAKVDLGHRPFS